MSTPMEEVAAAGRVLAALMAIDPWNLDVVLEQAEQDERAGDGTREEVSDRAQQWAVLREEINTFREIRKERNV